MMNAMKTREDSLLRRVLHRRPCLLFCGVHSAHFDQRESMKCCIINKGNSWNWGVGLGVACRK